MKLAQVGSIANKANAADAKSARLILALCKSRIMEDINYQLERFLQNSSRHFMNRDLMSIADLLQDNFAFKFYLNNNEGERRVVKGGKEDFLNIYRESFISGTNYSSWEYKIIHVKRTVLGNIKGILLFSCTSQIKDELPSKSTNIENFVCTIKNGKLRLKKLETRI